MTDLHAMAEEAVPPMIHVKLVDGAEPRSEVVAWVECALRELQAEHEVERTASPDVEAEFTRILQDYGGMGDGSWAAAKWYAQALVRKRTAAAAEALERAAQEVDRVNPLASRWEIAKRIRSLSSNAGDKVLVPSGALRVLEAAKVLTPLLEKGWHEYDTPDYQNIRARACEELVAATKAMLAGAGRGK